MNSLIRLRDDIAEVYRDGPWQLLHELPDALPSGPLLLPLAAQLERRGEAGAAAPWLAPDDEVEALLPHFTELPLIAIDFPSFRDGHGYNLVYLLCVRLGWSGELRTVGDVLCDQLSHVRQYGFDAFTVREDKNVEDALKGLTGLSMFYGRSAIEPRPLFRRRQVYAPGPTPIPAATPIWPLFRSRSEARPSAVD